MLPKVCCYLSQEDWKIVADCVADAASGSGTAAALASKILKPIHDRILVAANRTHPKHKLAEIYGAALVAHQKKLDRDNPPPRPWRAQCLQILMKDQEVAGQRDAIALCRELTGVSSQEAKCVIEALVDDLNSNQE